MKDTIFAAIDIGSNAVRLLIKKYDSDDEKLKKLLLLRVPLRLGFDVFDKGKVSAKKAENLLRLMKAYRQLMKIYSVDVVRACATSAMRDAENGPELIARAASRSRVAAAQAGRAFNNMAQAGDLNTASNVNAGAIGAGTITIHVTNNPVVNVNGGETDGIKEQLQQYDEEFLEKIRQIIVSILREQQEQEGRVAYA